MLSLAAAAGRFSDFSYRNTYLSAHNEVLKHSSVYAVSLVYWPLGSAGRDAHVLRTAAVCAPLRVRARCTSPTQTPRDALTSVRSGVCARGATAFSSAKFPGFPPSRPARSTRSANRSPILLRSRERSACRRARTQPRSLPHYYMRSGRLGRSWSSLSVARTAISARTLVRLCHRRALLQNDRSITLVVGITSNAVGYVTEYHR